MAKTDWTLVDVVKPSDMNDIGQEINQLRQDVDNIDFPISDATDGTRSNVAGSEKAVGLVMAEAQAAKTAGNERKQQAVDALIAWGVSASMADSWDTLFDKMSTVIKATGNATAADLLAGKTASNVNGPITGTMPNRGAGGTVTPGTTNQTKAAGYYSSPITVLGDADLVPSNIRSGVDLYGVIGSVIEGKRSKTGEVMPNPTTKVAVVAGLGFRPGLVMLMLNDSYYVMYATYLGGAKGVVYTNGQYSAPSVGITNDGFTVNSIPWNIVGEHTWFAVE